MKTYDEMAKDVLRRRDEYNIKRRNGLRRAAMISSFCFVLILAVGVALRGVLLQNSTTKDIEPEYREKRDVLITELSTAYIWPWEELEIYEKYFTFSLNGVKYAKHGGELSAAYVGEKIGDAVAVGYDEITDEEHKINCEVYSINKLNRYTAVKYEGYDEFYLYMEDEFSPPQSLGHLIEEYNLKEYLHLTEFYYTSDGEDSGHYYFSKAIWDMLLTYSNAPFEDYTYYQNGEDISFSATSEVLGINNRSFQITAEGYITTNIADYGYNFYIGTDAARKIIDYVYSNRGDEVPEEKEYYLIGTITEIGEDHIKVDDSIMMKDPEHGKVFTVYATTNEFKRYLKNNVLTVGELVQIMYDGTDDNGIIDSMVTIDDGIMIYDEETDHNSNNGSCYTYTSQYTSSAFSDAS